jgi:hypothetical protein
MPLKWSFFQPRPRLEPVKYALVNIMVVSDHIKLMNLFAYKCGDRVEGVLHFFFQLIMVDSSP